MLREAVIPAAGRGARLDRPNTPKPIVPVDGSPILSRLLRQLQEAGVERAHVVLGYGGAVIRRALYSDPTLKLDLQFHVSEDWRGGLAQSLLTVADALEGPFLLAMADHIFERALVDRAIRLTPEEGVVKLLADPKLDTIPDLTNAVKLSVQEAQATRVARNLEEYDLVDCGLMGCTTDLFDALREANNRLEKADLSHGLDILAGEGRVTASAIGSERWCDVDTPSDLVHGEMLLRRSRRRANLSRKPEPSLLRKEAGNKTFPFISQGQCTTISVGRGIIENPAHAGLIPDRCASSPIFVFTDETVNRIYGGRFSGELKAAGYDVHTIVLPDGEESKSMANYLYLVERILSRGVDERSVFISLGGGVPCNVCGFVASTLYRGLDLVHVPTSLMAQCDAAISHKQGINGARGKNMVGSYYPPRLVAVDIGALNTLSDDLIADGMSEVVKHALGQDSGYIDFLRETPLEARDPSLLEAVVTKNIELKCLLARDDPKEEREAMVLQYGHTVGHPVEHLSGYTVSHGQSVAIGMMVAARVARIMGACGDDLVQLHEELISKFALPTRIPAQISPRDILEAMKFNKKFLKEGTRMALLDKPGRLWSVDGAYAIPVSDDVLMQAIEQSMEEKTWTAESQLSLGRAAG